MSGVGMTAIAGGDDEAMLKNAGIGALSGAATGALVGGVTNGCIALKNKQTFWTGSPKVPAPSQAIRPPLKDDGPKIKPVELKSPEPLADLPSSRTPNTTPMSKGKMGVEMTLQQLREQGVNNAVTEVAYDLNGVRGRFDIGYYDVKKDVFNLIEVKTGLNARYTHNQMINYPQIMNQHPSVVFHGGKAEMMMSTTGYSVGTQVTNYNFIIFHYYF